MPSPGVTAVTAAPEASEAPITSPSVEAAPSDDPFTSDIERMVGSILAEDREDDGDDEILVDPAVGDDAEEGDATDDADVTEDEDDEDGAVRENGGASAPAEAAPPAAWEDLVVRADREMVPIPEAKVTRVNGSVMIGMPEAEYARFQARLSRGVVAERLWRQLDQGVRELEARKAQPARKSDAEVEAEITLAALKPFLPELIDQRDLELLQARVQLAQRAETDRYAKDEQDRVSQAAAPAWEEQQARGIAELVNQILVAPDVLAAHPELAELTREEVAEVYQRALLPIGRALYYKDGDQVVANTELILGHLRSRALQKHALAATPPASAPAKDAATAATPARTARPGQGQTPVARAERLNQGADAAQRTTALKANRTTRPAMAHTRDAGHPNGRADAEREKLDAAVDEYSKKSRAYLSTPGWDIGDDEDA